ncbi:MAG: UMP kinase [Patescibacteria group bacterium]|nr:UMP kinase [Patescibacteria group bacterium]
MMAKFFVISLGGSLINPGEINTRFLKGFKRLILKHARNGSRFLIITGGGQLCRDYNRALEQISRPTLTDLDWMGINVTWVNAKLVQLMFGNAAHPEILKDPDQKLSFKKAVAVGGGWKPGRSSDGATVKYAQNFGAHTVINLSNVDYVYNKDPRKYKDAKKIETISWLDFRKIVGNKWDPGANLPFDPTAAKLAQAKKIRVIIARGTDLANLEKILSGKKAKGTVIE